VNDEPPAGWANQLDKAVNRLRGQDGGDAVRLGSFLVSGSPMMAEAMAQSSLDWLVIDMEAGAIGKAEVLTLLQTLNAYPAVPVVRVPDHGRHCIEACMDLGARGILVPKVNSAEDARALVDAVRYPPLGSRSVNCIRASRYYTQAGRYVRQANDAIALLLQIETAAGLEHCDAIAAVEGVDGLFVGPGDLAAALGTLGNVGGPAMASARARVLEACRRHGKGAGIFAHDVASCQSYGAEGFRLIAIGNEIKFALDALHRAIDLVHKPTP
jgi:2-keto-3-deoxy-L-rhamnonate aldolase RhmA